MGQQDRCNWGLSRRPWIIGSELVREMRSARQKGNPQGKTPGRGGGQGTMTRSQLKKMEESKKDNETMENEDNNQTEWTVVKNKKQEAKRREQERKEAMEKMEKAESKKTGWKSLRFVETTLKRMERDYTNIINTEERRKMRMKIDIYEKRNKWLMVQELEREKREKRAQQEKEKSIDAEETNTIMSDITQKTINNRKPITPVHQVTPNREAIGRKATGTGVVLETLGKVRTKKNSGNCANDKEEQNNTNKVTQEDNRTIMSDITHLTIEEQKKAHLLLQR